MLVRCSGGRVSSSLSGCRRGSVIGRCCRYEHGTRHLTVLRFVEISRELITDAPTLLSRGLQRARVYVENLTLAVDLRALLHDGSDTFRPLVQWARNALNEHPDGIAYVEPAVVRNLALFIGCSRTDLTNYLARFTPEDN